jgi:hypothetical protein
MKRREAICGEHRLNEKTNTQLNWPQSELATSPIHKSLRVEPRICPMAKPIVASYPYWSGYLLSPSTKHVTM